MFEKNIAVLKKRWPVYAQELAAMEDDADAEYVADTPSPTMTVSGLHVASCFDAKAEAGMQAQMIPDGCLEVWLYGVGIGELPRLLLARPKLERLNVVVMSSRVFHAILDSFDQCDWLQDERVSLLTVTDVQDIQTPFAAVPVELKFVDAGGEILRDRVLLEIESPYINARYLSNQECRQQIEDNYSLVEQDGDVAQLWGTAKGKEAYVIGAGPTLEEGYERLAMIDRDNALIIAVDAALQPLLNHHITPDVVVTIDGHKELVTALLDVGSLQSKAIDLIYFPIVHGQALALWAGKRYAAYSASEIFEEIRKNYPKEILFSAGTVYHPAVDVAVKLGCDKVYFIGADFSYPVSHSHARGVPHGAKVEIASDATVRNYFGQSVRSARNFVNYVRDLESYIAKHPQVVFVNLGKKGAFIEGVVYEA